MNRNLLLASVAAMAAMAATTIGAPLTAHADGHDNGPNFTFGASVSYGYDFNDPMSGATNASQNVNTYSSQEQDESFNIDMLQLGLSGDRGALSYEGTLVFGDLAAMAGDSRDGDIGLQTLSATWDLGPAAVTAGRFATPIGYEVLAPWGNANISRSRGWLVQPINHDGLTVSGTADVFDFMIGVANNFTVADNSTAGAGGNDNDDEKAILGSFGTTIGEDHSLYVSGLFTQEGDSTDIWLVNAIMAGMIGFGDIDIDYALEGTVRNDDDEATSTELRMWNVALYGGTDVGPGGVDVRVDFTEDEGLVPGVSGILSGLPGASDYQAVSVTVTGSLPLTPGVDVRLEYRFDTANEDIFGDDDSMSDSTNSLQAQVVWHPGAE